MKQSYAIEELSQVVATHVMPLLKKYTIITFKGPLGAGKTTMIKQVLKACGITQVVTSPTFAYVNTYENERGELFHHFDLYRLQSGEEFEMAGFAEYFHQPKSWCFIEWPEVITSLLDRADIRSRVCMLSLQHEPEAPERRILMSKTGEERS